MRRGYQSRFNCSVLFAIIGGLSVIIGTEFGGHPCSPDCPKCAAKASDRIAFRAKVIRCS